MYGTSHGTNLTMLWELMMLKQKIKFDNRSIRNHHSDFTGVNGKTKQRVYSPFNISKTTQYSGLNLCEYKKGGKHFVQPNSVIRTHKSLDTIY